MKPTLWQSKIAPLEGAGRRLTGLTWAEVQKAEEAATLSQSCFDFASRLTGRQRVFEMIRNTKSFAQFIISCLDEETYDILAEGSAETLMSMIHLEGLKLSEKVVPNPIGILFNRSAHSAGPVSFDRARE